MNELVHIEPAPLSAPEELNHNRQRRMGQTALEIQGPFLPDFDIRACKQATERVRFDPEDDKRDKALRHAAFEAILAPTELDVRQNMRVQRALHYAKKRQRTAQSLHPRSHQYDKLHPDDATALFGIMEQGLAAYQAVHTGNLRQTSEEQNAYANFAIAHDLLCLSTLGLVGFLAYSYSRATNFPKSDLYQAGSLSLIQAVRKYDAWSEKDYEFSTHAAWAIKGGMYGLLAESGKYIGLSSQSFWRWRRIQNARSELQQKLRRSPTDAEVAGETGVAEGEVEMLTRLTSLTPASLDKPLHEDGRTSLGESIAANNFSGDDTDEQLLSHAQMRAIAARANLTNNEWFVIALRYGFVDTLPQLQKIEIEAGDSVHNYPAFARTHLVDKNEAGLPIDKIGQMLGISRDKALAIELRAMRALRAHAYTSF
jgi:RNA polymerase sigma factor (sigma-70 family)